MSSNGEKKHGPRTRTQNNFVLDNLNCTGNEASIFDCAHNGEWNEDCMSGEIAAVKCYNLGKAPFF